jgi:hypothetical protein
MDIYQSISKIKDTIAAGDCQLFFEDVDKEKTIRENVSNLVLDCEKRILEDLKKNWPEAYEVEVKNDLSWVGNFDVDHIFYGAIKYLYVNAKTIQTDHSYRTSYISPILEQTFLNNDSCVIVAEKMYFRYLPGVEKVNFLILVQKGDKLTIYKSSFFGSLLIGDFILGIDSNRLYVLLKEIYEIKGICQFCPPPEN